MSTLLEQASLVMIPSGYKEDVVYSQIPTNGNGDLSFTRASNGTRVNSAGLVEVCPWNLVTYSSVLSDASYNSGEVTISYSQTDPNGGNTGALFTGVSATNAFIIKPFTTIIGQVYTWFVYLKGNSSGSVSIRAEGAASAPVNNVNYTTSYQQFTYTFTADSTSTNLIIGGFGSWTGSEAIYVAFPQANIGSTAKPYFPTTDRLNVPRLTYQNGGGGCPSLLLEKQSTNEALWSEDFTQTAWVKTTGGSGSAPSVTANAGISPDGTQNADRVQFDCVGTTTSDRSILRQSISISNSTAYTFTFYVKAYSSGEIGKELNIRAENITGNPNITLTADWQRVSVSGTSSATSTLLIVETRGSVTANTTADILIWGAQLEASSYSTSYIQTTSSSATRVADACFKTGISSLIGQTEGVLFIDFVWNQLTGTGSYPRIIEAWNNGNNYIQLFNVAGTESVYYEIANGGAIQFSGNTTLNLGRNKLALAYKLNDCVLYKNGALIASDTSATIPATNDLGICGTYNGSSGAQLSASVNEVVLFKTRLTNAELASLTTI